MADTFPLKLLLLTVSGWVNRHQQDTIAYLVEENRILKEKLGGKCPRLNDDQRRRLAALAKRLGRRTLNQVATVVTPDTLMRWYRKLIAVKWTFPAKKRVGRVLSKYSADTQIDLDSVPRPYRDDSLQPPENMSNSLSSDFERAQFSRQTSSRTR